MSFSKLPCGQSGPHVGKTITHKRKRELEKAQSSEDLESGERSIKRPAISIGDFRVLSILGQGAFGKVVLASLPGENQTVAIKCIPKKEVTTSLLRESRILQQVRGSPFICHAYAGLQSESHAYFIMEHLPGGSLGSLIEQRECLPDHLVEFYTAELVCGIQFLHERGIAHRDLKPDNIMLDEDGHVKIIDLGLAQDQLTGGRTISGRCGTPDYMAPEILMGVGRMIARGTSLIGRRRCEGHRCFVRFSWASLMELPWIGGPSASPWQKC
ncbi:putative protein kinase C delta type homolog isoform X2 [Hyperolius riggenbachi]|uniref:putative protein kinase C delta type homolog isoform X2 n=1 Tax=Hyperolius riggenbachi TaxID=752182 RepID=UPI0035A32DB0